MRTSTSRRDHSPSPPMCRTTVPSEPDGSTATPLRGGEGSGIPPMDWIFPTTDDEWERYGQDHREEDPQVILPTRTTLCHFSSARGSLFAQHSGAPPRPALSRTFPERMGLSEDSEDVFHARLDR